MIRKLKEYFGDMIVYKDSRNQRAVAELNLPSFIRDWLLSECQDKDGNINTDTLNEIVENYLPKKSHWKTIKDRIVSECEDVQILTKINADINISNRNKTFVLPEFAGKEGLAEKDSYISDAVWEEHKTQLLKANDKWGILTLGYYQCDDGRKTLGKIELKDFEDFCPYEIDTQYYKEARKEFSFPEWLDVLLGACDYNGAGFNEKEKLTMLCRLIPFVQKNVNLVELAPKGTGKSYMFRDLSKYGTLADGGKITRASMFYNMSNKKSGFICGNDYAAIDEIKLVNFGNDNEMRSILQGYMEKGEFNISGYQGSSNAGVVFLGNIESDRMDEFKDMLHELPPLFKESALLDRIHGFIKGWDIPRISDDMKACGWALDTEYFTSILHELRDDISYASIVDEITELPPKADTRDVNAIKKIATALLKLLFPNVQSAKDVNRREFLKYCLMPAKQMRSIIKMQMGFQDKEFKGKGVPAISVVEL